MKQNIQNNWCDKKGFTLLELLVVIAIIAILVVAAVVTYSTARRRGVDAQRRSNVKATQDGFEQYFADNNSTYNNVSGDNVCSMSSANLAKYFPSGFPTGLTCSLIGGGTGYCICAELEDASDGNSGAGCNFSATTHYCLTNLQ